MKLCGSNPSSYTGQDARLETCRKCLAAVANLVNAKTDEVIFTGGIRSCYANIGSWQTASLLVTEHSAAKDALLIGNSFYS